MIELILGGARSGKSRLAEQRAIATGLERVYIATATAQDAEMQQRIAQHQLNRQHQGWHTIEEPLSLAQVLTAQAQSNRCILVDCLTLWVSNHLCQSTTDFAQAKQELLQQLAKLPGTIILVSNETGMGVVPMGQLSRDFVDQSGWLHQQIAQLADTVILTVAGLPHYLKGSPTAASGGQNAD